MALLKSITCTMLVARGGKVWVVDKERRIQDATALSCIVYSVEKQILSRSSGRSE